MNTYKTQADEVNLTAVQLSNFDKSSTLNILPQLRSLSIYEDITRPTMCCELNIQDNINLLTTFPLIGEEYLQFSFMTPKQPDAEPIQMKFRVYSLGGVSMGLQNRSQTYTLFGVSEEHIAAISTTIEKSYEGTVAESVQDLLTSYLNTKKDIFVDTTKSTSPIVVPSMNVLRTIDFFRRRAVSPQYPSSSFVFFENKNGFHFRTVEALIKDGLSSNDKLFYKHTPLVSASTESARALELFSIINYAEIAKQDNIDKIQLGTFDCVVSTYDFITKKYDMVDFNWEEHEHKVVKTDQRALAGSKELLNKLGEISGKKGNAKKAMNYFLPKDASRPEHFIETSLGLRQAYATLVSQASLVILVPGNTRAAVGDVIKVDFSTVQRDTRSNDNPKQTALSGDYLVSKLRHVIVPGTVISHRMSLELVRVGSKV